MARRQVRVEKAFDGQNIINDATLTLEGQHIIAITGDASPPPAPVIKGVVTPGFVDLQVNGGGDVLLNTTPTREGMQAIAAAHRKLGTVAIMPTVITDHPDVLPQVAQAAIDAHHDDGIAGLHIEGPHIALAKRGTHAREFVRPMDKQTLLTVEQLRKADVTVMITVAPEAITTRQIQALVAMRAIVSIGHTNANDAQVNAAIAAGCSCATHLFNAMSPMTSREPGAVGAVISSGIHTGIICDGQHVHDAMVSLALRARPVANTVFLVSDAMPTVGGGDSFELYGETVSLQQGRLINSAGGLAGAHVTQTEGVKRLVQHVGIGLGEALRMATSIPASFIGKPGLGKLTGRDARDAIVLNDDLTLQGTLADCL